MHVRELFGLSEKVAIVTGGSRGLGLQMATALGEAGASLVLTARKADELAAAAAGLTARGVRALAVPCDVSRADEVDAAVARTLQAYGRVDILLNNAGATWGASILEMPLEAWRKVMETNVDGMFLMARAAGRAMIDAGRGGKIVNIASVAGLVGADAGVLDAIGYSTSKGAVIAFTRDLAVKWARHRITVNAIAPGYFPSKMTRWLIEHRGEAILDTIPMGRWGGEDDLKGAALFLASPASDFITGHILVVDGGQTAR
ncbi:MAG TPA: SDR family oxidoreductase [bacterium]|nr:SDR family oxidoreductase [bacterium]